MWLSNDMWLFNLKFLSIAEFIFRGDSVFNDNDDEDMDDEIFGNPAKVSL